MSPQQDTPLHQFTSIVTLLQNCTTLEDRNALVTFAVGQATGDVATLLFKHADLVRIYGTLNRIAAFAEHGLTPKELIEAKKVFWGVRYLTCLSFASFSDIRGLLAQMLDPFIRGGLLQLMVFGSHDVWPPATVPEKYTGDTGSPIISGIVASDYKWQPAILDPLVEIFNLQFEGHLESQMEYFAQKQSPIWTAAFAKYEKAVMADVAKLSQEEPGVYSDLDAKLKTILGNQAANGYPFAPRVPGKIPMFCPKFQKALYGLFKKLSPALSLVSSELFSIYLRTPSH